MATKKKRAEQPQKKPLNLTKLSDEDVLTMLKDMSIAFSAAGEVVQVLMQHVTNGKATERKVALSILRQAWFNVAQKEWQRRAREQIAGLGI